MEIRYNKWFNFLVSNFCTAIKEILKQLEVNIKVTTIAIDIIEKKLLIKQATLLNEAKTVIGVTPKSPVETIIEIGKIFINSCYK